MTLPIVISIIGVLISAVSVIAVIYFNSKNSKHTDNEDEKARTKEKIEEIKERTKENAIINAKLESIILSNQEIKEQVSSLVKKIDAHESRIIKVEESLKTAWHEIGEIKEKIDKEGEQ